MGFQYEPCPVCPGPTKITLIQTVQETKGVKRQAHVKCFGCNLQLNCTGGSLLDCARAWNTRVQRLTELAKHDRNVVTLLHSDLAANYDGKQEYVFLDNSDSMWKIVRGAELAWNEDYSAARPDIDYLKIDSFKLMKYLYALNDEIADRY